MGFAALLLILSLITVTDAFVRRAARPLNWKCHDAASSTSLAASEYDMLIWDCDGVLVDSEALLKKGEVDALRELGFSLTTDDCTRLFSGVAVDQAMSNFEAEMGKPLPETFFKEQVEGSLDLFRRELQPLMADTVKALHGASVPMCVASGSRRDRVLLAIDVGGMRDCLPDEVVFTRELVAKGKPAPDLFLYTAEKMGVQPERCVVVEDSTSGVEAALAAGMHCVSFLGGGHAQQDWYRQKILSYSNVPTTYTQKEVLDYVMRMFK